MGIVHTEYDDDDKFGYYNHIEAKNKSICRSDMKSKFMEPGGTNMSANYLKVKKSAI